MESKSEARKKERLMTKMKPYNDENIVEKYGFEIFGPLLYGFLSWVIDEAICEKADRILFFARDGYVMQKAFDKMESGISSDYLYVSRRSLTVPLLIDAESMEDVLRIVPYIKREESVENFLHKVGIDDEEVEKKLTNIVGATIRRSDLSGNIGAEIFNIIHPYMKSNAEQEMGNASKYLHDYFYNQKVIVVDLGWYGTIQKSIEKLLTHMECKAEIVGLYIGRLYRSSSDTANNMKGFIYNFDRENKAQNTVFGYNGLIESFFSANHGSTKKYLENGNPVLEKYEEENWDMISRLHHGALKYVDQMAHDNKRRNDFSPTASFKNAYRLFVKPSLAEVELFGNIIFYDAYYEPLVNYRGLKHYIVKPKDLYNDFLVSNWKIGFLKKATRILPAKLLYTLLVNLKG